MYIIQLDLQGRNSCYTFVIPTTKTQTYDTTPWRYGLFYLYDYKVLVFSNMLLSLSVRIVTGYIYDVIVHGCGGRTNVSLPIYTDPVFKGHTCIGTIRMLISCVACPYQIKNIKESETPSQCLTLFV